MCNKCMCNGERNAAAYPNTSCSQVPRLRTRPSRTRFRSSLRPELCAPAALPRSEPPAPPVGSAVPHTERTKVAAALFPRESPGKEASIHTAMSALTLGQALGPHIGGTCPMYIVFTLSDMLPLKPPVHSLPPGPNRSHSTHTVSRGVRPAASLSLFRPTAVRNPTALPVL